MNVEQRKSLRTQIPEGHAPAVLFVGDTKVDVRILDESAGGFAVVVLADISLEPNQVHLLQTATGWCETRVARIECYPDGKLLGLVRLRNLAGSPETLAAGSQPESSALSQRAWSAGGGVLAAICGAVAIGLFLGLVALCYISSRSHSRRSASPALRQENTFHNE